MNANASVGPGLVGFAALKLTMARDCRLVERYPIVDRSQTLIMLPQEGPQGNVGLHCSQTLVRKQIHLVPRKKTGDPAHAQQTHKSHKRCTRKTNAKAKKSRKPSPAYLNFFSPPFSCLSISIQSNSSHSKQTNKPKNTKCSLPDLPLPRSPRPLPEASPRLPQAKLA